MKDANPNDVAAYYLVCLSDGSPQSSKDEGSVGFCSLFAYSSLPKLREALAMLRRPPCPRVVVPLAMLNSGHSAAVPGYEYPTLRPPGCIPVCGTSLDFAAMLLLQMHESLRAIRASQAN